MTFVGSLCIMLALAGVVFLLGLLGVHFSLPPQARRSLMQTFWSTVVRKDSDALADVPPGSRDGEEPVPVSPESVIAP